MDKRRRRVERPGAVAQQAADRPPYSYRRKSLLNQYHRIAHDILADSTIHLPDSLVSVIKSGHCGKLASLLKQPNGQRLLNAHHPLTGDTPLIIAARSGNKEAVSILLSKGADATLENESGESALEVASPEIKRVIMDSISTCETNSDQTLLNAAWLGDSVKVKQCLNGDQYIDVNCTSHGGMTPLLLVTKDMALFEKVYSTIQREYNPVEAMKELLEKHADVTASDKHGRSALHLVAADSSVHARRMVSLLLTHGSDVDTVDRKVCTPLHHATESGNMAIVIALVEEGGADVNKACGERGDTPLITTARHGHSQQARYLLSHGADVRAVNEDGDTALSVAATMSMVHLLKEAWTEATQVQGPPPTDPTHRRHLSAEQAVLEELDKTVGEYDSEVERATPTSLEVTPPREADCVFFEDGDGGPSQHPKAFMTEAHTLESPFSPVVRSLSDPSLATKVQQKAHKDSSLQDLVESGLGQRSNSVKTETRPQLKTAAKTRPPSREGEEPRPRSRAKSMADIETPALLLRRSQLRSSLQNVKEGKALQSTPGVSMHVRRHSHDKVLKGSLESVAMTTSSQMNGPAEQRLPQLERGGVTTNKPTTGAKRGVKTTQTDKLPSLPKNAMPLAMVAVEMDKETMYVHQYGNADPTPHPLDSSSTSGLRKNSAKVMKKAKSQSTIQSESRALSGQQQSGPSTRRRFSDAMVGLKGVAILPSQGGARDDIALPQLQVVAPYNKGKDPRPHPQHEKHLLPKGQAALPGPAAAQHLSSVTETPESNSTSPPLGGENPEAASSALLATPSPLHASSSALFSSSELMRTASTVIGQGFSTDSLEPSSDDTLRAASNNSGEYPVINKEDAQDLPLQEQSSTIPVLPEVSKAVGVTYLAPPPPVKVGNIVINTAGPLEGNSPLSPIWYLQRQSSSDAGSSSSPDSFIHSNLGRHTPVQRLRAPEPPNTCPRQDSGQGESDSDKQSYDESDDSTDNQVIDTDVDQVLRWKKGKLLGKGAYGRVWEGLTDSTRMIAVKEVELDVDCQERAQSQFEKLQVEVGILRSLYHKNIVGYLGACMNDGMVYIFMEYISGGSIQNILKRFGPLSERCICNYTKQILKALHYLHYNRIIHRDIKGANIMVTPKGMVKLIDFGCAKKFMQQLDRSMAMHSVRGTPYWMAPEIILGHKYGPKSDIWSLGATIHEMATTKPPWGTLVPEAAMFQIGIGKSFPSLPEEVSDSLNDLYRKCLTRDPTQRPSSEQLLDHHFFAQFQVKKKRTASKRRPLKSN